MGRSDASVQGPSAFFQTYARHLLFAFSTRGQYPIPCHIDVASLQLVYGGSVERGCKMGCHPFRLRRDQNIDHCQVVDMFPLVMSAKTDLLSGKDVHYRLV